MPSAGSSERPARDLDARASGGDHRFPSKSVVVVGDLIVDEYLYGKPARISREAPVLILRFTGARHGSAAPPNASHNVHTLGARVVPIGVVGSDAAGEEMFALLRAAGIPTDGVAREPGRPTPIKTRIMAGGYQSTRQQVVRVDREPPAGPSPPPRTRSARGSPRSRTAPTPSSSRTMATAP